MRSSVIPDVKYKAGDIIPKGRDKQMYCKNCGNQLNDGQAFCDKCGYQVGGAGEERKQGGPQYIYVREKSEGIAAVLSFFFVGLGQIYVGKLARGILLMLAYMTIISVAFIVVFFVIVAVENFGGVIVAMVVIVAIGLAIEIWNIFDAYKLAKEYNEYVRTHGDRPW